MNLHGGLVAEKQRESSGLNGYWKQRLGYPAPTPSDTWEKRYKALLRALERLSNSWDSHTVLEQKDFVARMITQHKNNA